MKQYVLTETDILFATSEAMKISDPWGQAITLRDILLKKINASSNEKYTRWAIVEVCKSLHILPKRRKQLTPLIKEGLKRYSGNIIDTIWYVKRVAQL